MRVPHRPSLILVLFIGLLVFYGVLLVLTANAVAEEPASPQPSITFSPPAPSPLPSATPVNHHRWAKLWAKQAATNRGSLKTLSRRLSRPLPRLCHRLGQGATDRAWNRYGVRCKAKAVKFVKLRKTWAKAWRRIQSDPVALGRHMAAEMGWTGYQWTALYRLWSAESGWRVTAANPTSSAYGIPQALPGSKMGEG